MKTQMVLVLGALLLVACSGQPVPEEELPPEEEVPELTLNLPANGDCACGPEQENFTFLEKGINSLGERAYLDALQYFQSYQRIEDSEQANLEAGIAIAYLSILPDSPIYDRDAARESYSKIRQDLNGDVVLNKDVQLMRDAMESFLDLYDQIDRLKVSNSDLRTELEKREDAIKRLRDLTLGRESEPAGLLGN
jgi:hypothetical protein